MHLGRYAIARTAQRRRPEQAVEVNDVLADEVVDLAFAVKAPEVVELETLGAVAEILEARHVADGCVHPDVEILVLGAGDDEAEVRPIATDVPGLETAGQPLRQLVRDFGLDRVAGRPLFEEVAELRDIEEVVIG